MMRIASRRIRLSWLAMAVALFGAACAHRTIHTGRAEGPLLEDVVMDTAGVPRARADTFAVWAAAIEALGGAWGARTMLQVDTVATSPGADSTLVARLKQMHDRSVLPVMMAAHATSGAGPMVIDLRMLQRFTRYEVLPGRDRFTPSDSAWMRRNDMLAHVALSRVVLDDARSHALVWASWTCGGLCGAARMMLMERDPAGRWVVKDTIWGVLF